MPGAMVFIVIELKEITLRMDANKNHKRPHLHIQYGRKHHAASYAIDNGTRLAGDLESRHDRITREWIGSHREKLLELWKVAQDGKRVDGIVAQLRAGA
jgi:hypothetical protein